MVKASNSKSRLQEGKNCQILPRIVKEKKTDTYHFYLCLSRKQSTDELPPMKQMDIGIALSHFVLTAREEKLKGKLVKKNPNIDTSSGNLYYIASWIGE